MTMADFSSAEGVIRAAVPDVCPAAQIVIRRQGHEVFSGAYGWLDPDTRRREVTRDTRFDLASVTKLFVVTTFMTLVEEGLVALEQPVSSVLPDVSGLRPVQPYEDLLTPGALVHVVPEA